mmetsp:Transcript_18374/g.39474  ORF Transcript_18374/g.39474 Transcript_18374/m.39474 type:complete len:638 (-) Transcript_18374:175-2088(-)|eukprot:CAMPEP_0172529300 /NCGR_PEP_ID=MMETSP1067-20121228/3414_1 /TAXON_ID=265564 ORGANISM="Thalassiosira punctigera, Strain Tpunct2005C2" /NCGR_SAMPLE_ID=MMETSP1067 /ASSEMBLY_ACC=CAM_ASM_000444 /LENGTH=637 /DNA_ID=CAMNT_0013313331 /DNA_START=142 /DNA_END=2055 /DNA_ORIENTATION=+
MPRGRKRSAAADGTSTTSGVTSGRSSSRRSAGGAGDVGATPAMDPAMMNVWGDFMSEEMSAPAPAAPAASSSTAPAASKAESPKEKPSPAAAVAAAVSPESGPRDYVLPIKPKMRLSGKKHKGDDANGDRVLTPGLLAQTGTLDASVPGRSSISKTPLIHELLAPTLLFTKSIFARTKIAFITSSPTACHSIAITSAGAAYGWGRNETGQLGLGSFSAVAPLPTLLTVSGEESLKFVGAGVGKYHTILVGSNGVAYASGGNLCGQLGINNANATGVQKFRKCSVMGQIGGGGEDDDDEDDVGGVKIVKASCGENISALLSSAGHLYTAGSSEFGQLGNGETGEYIVSAGKLGFSNCAKFVRRSIFSQSESEAAGNLGAQMMTGKGVDSAGKIKCVSLEDSGQIRLADVCCGKNHTVAVEAPSSSGTPRVFTWGCGDYGCLGHGIQADEYTPRMVGGLRGPIFASNHPVSAVAGSNCTLVKTKNGHVYYVGKHKQAGEATMRPTLVDALANNGHVVTSIGAGSQTVFCSTKSGVTVSWGNGSHGELGYGEGENKSSSKPKFVNGLDSCLVSDVACGMGHTLFIVRDEDEDDAKALKKVGRVEEEDLAQFMEEMKGKKGASDVGGDEPVKKKAKGKGKK